MESLIDLLLVVPIFVAIFQKPKFVKNYPYFATHSGQEFGFDTVRTNICNIENIYLYIDPICRILLHFIEHKLWTMRMHILFIFHMNCDGDFQLEYLAIGLCFSSCI